MVDSLLKSIEFVQYVHSFSLQFNEPFPKTLYNSALALALEPLQLSRARYLLCMFVFLF